VTLFRTERLVLYGPCATASVLCCVHTVPEISIGGITLLNAWCVWRRTGEEEVDRLVYMLDVKQGKREVASSAFSESTNAGRESADDQGSGTSPPAGDYTSTQLLLEAARASKYFPQLQAAEIGDDFLELVLSQTISEEYFDAALERAGLPIGPRIAITACLQQLHGTSTGDAT